MRKSYVDYIKAIGIILVILGHINFANSHFGIKEWVYAFHMPLFFFSTGLVIRETHLNIDFFVKKFKVLMIPYIIWGLLYILYKKLSIKSILYILFGSYETLTRAKTLTSLWFLPAMYFGVVITQLVFKICKKDYQRLIAMLLLGVAGVFIPSIGIGYPLCIDVAVLAAAFILFGHFFEKVMENRFKGRLVIFTLLGAAGTLLFRLNSFDESTYVLMAKRNIGNPIIFFITAIMGCIMVYGFSRIIDKGMTNKVLSFIGANTLVIFAVQKPIIHLCEKVFSQVRSPWYLELTVTGIVTLAISCVLAAVINKLLPMLNGK